MPPPSEDEILALMVRPSPPASLPPTSLSRAPACSSQQMGFERAQAVQALTRAGNNVEVAANYLLSGT